jgi:hypothetical protein
MLTADGRNTFTLFFCLVSFAWHARSLGEGGSKKAPKFTRRYNCGGRNRKNKFLSLMPGEFSCLGIAAGLSSRDHRKTDVMSFAMT